MKTTRVRCARTLRGSVGAVAASVLVAVSMTVGVTGAHALPPVASPLPAGSVDFSELQVPCGPLHMETSAGETQRVFLAKDGAPRFALITGPFSVVVTNTVTGKTLSLNVPGPLKITGDGLTLYGPSLILGPSEVWLTHGPVFFANGSLDPTNHRGQYTDLCPLLS